MSDYAEALRSRIESQIELVAQLICSDQDAQKACRRLECLTYILIKVEVEEARALIAEQSEFR